MRLFGKIFYVLRDIKLMTLYVIGYVLCSLTVGFLLFCYFFAFIVYFGQLGEIKMYIKHLVSIPY